MRIIKLTAVLVFLCVSAFGQMPGAQTPCADCPPGSGRVMVGMESSAMPFMTGPNLRAACHTDLGALGLSADVRKALEDERFELQKLVIRNLAEMKVLEMELEQLLASREFDLETAGKKLDKISSTENKVREAHLKFLRSLASKLDDERWGALRGEMTKPMPSGMRPMMGTMQPGMMARMGEGMMPCEGCRGPCGEGRNPCGCCREPCDRKPCGQSFDRMPGAMMPQGGMMQGSMMQGGQMPCGMLPGEMMTGAGAPPSPAKAAPSGDPHHPSDAKDAEEFFKDK